MIFIWRQRGATSYDWQFGRVWISIRHLRYWRTSGPGFIRIVPVDLGVWEDLFGE